MGDTRAGPTHHGDGAKNRRRSRPAPNRSGAQELGRRPTKGDLEDIVGSIFQDFGYQVRITGQRVPGEEGDDGVDVIFESSGGTVGIQVRW